MRRSFGISVSRRPSPCCCRGRPELTRRRSQPFVRIDGRRPWAASTTRRLEIAALNRVFAEAVVTKNEIAIADLHATGTPGDLNELSHATATPYRGLVDDYVGEHTRITTRKGQLGHGLANLVRSRTKPA